MRGVFVALAIIAPSAALAQSAPHKLIIHWYQAGVVVVDYPSQARCEQARKAVQAEVDRREQDFKTRNPSFVAVTGPANGAFCIPG